MGDEYLGFSEGKLMEEWVDLEGDGEGFESGARFSKKSRVDYGGDMKRVAEIVMVLSALGEMRGGRSPSVVELGFMAEAREKLAAMCEGVSPKDFIPREAVRVLVEDLGLNGSRDQRFGFRPPKMSIAEKVSLTKRKMEESKEFAPQVGFGTKSESHGNFFRAGAAHRFPQDKRNSVSPSTAGFQPAVPIYALPAASLLNQSHVNETQSSNARMAVGPSISSLEGVPSPLALPRTEGVHFRLEAQSNGPSYLSHVQGSSGDNLVEKAPTLASLQSPLSTAKVGQASNLSDRTPKVSESVPEVNPFQFAPQAISDNSAKAFAVQTATGNPHAIRQPSQGINFVLAPSLYTNHIDIAKNVQKILQPRLPDHPNWTIPSIDYMNKSLTCQICKVSINDVESLLVCDGCEKGVHLKCLKSFNQKGIPKGEWHCPKCLGMSDGKPFVPKYGRVSRNTGAPKVTSNTTEVRASPEKRMENSDQKVNHHKIIANGNPCLPISAQVASTRNNNIVDFKSNGRELQSVDFSVSGTEKDDGHCNEICTDLSKDRTGFVSVLAGAQNETDNRNVQFSESSPYDMERSTPAQLSDNGIDTCHPSQMSCVTQGDETTFVHAEISEIQMHEISKGTCEDLKRPSNLRQATECKPGYDFKREDQGGDRAVSNRNLDSGNGASDCARSSLKELNIVDWDGDVLQVADGKTYYKSCSIGGVVYKLQDYALFRSNNHKLSPSKLQALWEDNKTSSKWAIVNRCYFPDDLPKVVGRPCTPEKNEVYESNHGSTIIAGLIRGPCEVIPPNKYMEECEKRTHVEQEANCALHPIFLCKWFYDEPKGLFRPVTD
ncbi:uncharacterized protein LOC143855020 isoform X2 [Tasmannia lanceolata]|uniref:uncharacterized protein LOC143855020 isoform X2 n=1 Tax=Tasmannia lanceolata TaxID=3420 RepID=UPI004062C0D1